MWQQQLFKAAFILYAQEELAPITQRGVLPGYETLRLPQVRTNLDSILLPAPTAGTLQDVSDETKQLFKNFVRHFASDAIDLVANDLNLELTTKQKLHYIKYFAENFYNIIQKDLNNIARNVWKPVKDILKQNIHLFTPKEATARKRVSLRLLTLALKAKS